MVTVNNNWIIITKDDNAYLPVKLDLSYRRPIITVKLKNGYKKKLIQEDDTLYTTSQDGSLNIPSGVFSYLSKYFCNSTVVDNRTKIADLSHIADRIEDYKSILGNGIILRDTQLVALRKILYIKRCLIQMCTGAGKTEVMCALAKILSAQENGVYPTSLVIEPTVKLVNDIRDRFEKYNIPTALYSKNRKITENVVNICHPLSLGNDLKDNPNLLNTVRVLLCDESHHMAADTFRYPTYHMNNLEFCVGVTASAIDQSRVSESDISKLTYREALTLAATGPLVLNVRTEQMMDKGALANPVLMMLHNEADEDMKDKHIGVWHKVADIRLESDTRLNTIVECAEFFNAKNRKTLILARTIKSAEYLLKEMYNRGFGDRVRCSFGNKVFKGYNGELFLDKTDVFKNFSKGEITVIIGTSHLYEGADIENLDVLILGYGGKAERMQIQGVGRVLRKTKTGKFAYIIDFLDCNDYILNNHSNKRFERYKSIIGVPKDRIFYDINVTDMKHIFNTLEIEG